MKMLFLLFLLLFVPTLGQAAITCTGTSFPFNTPADPQAQDYTVPTVSNGITFVYVATRPSTRTIAAITIGGAAVTQIGARLPSTDTAGSVYYRLNTTAGVNSISVDFDSAPLSYVLTAVTCAGVSQSNPVPISNTATGTGTTVTVDCAGTSTGQVVLDFVAADGNAAGLTTGANQTNIDQDIADATLSSGSSSEPGNGTITMSHTISSNDWGTFCVALNALESRRGIAPLVFQ